MKKKWITSGFWAAVLKRFTPMTLGALTLYYPGCDETVVQPSNSDCPPKELGDIRGYAFIKNTFSFVDITDPTEWETGINAGDIFVFALGRGGLEMTENEVPGFGDEDVTNDGYNYTATIYDPQYKANWAFWNSIKNAKSYKFAYVTETLVHLSDKEVTVIPKQPITEGEKRTAIIWQVMVKWAQDDLIRPYDRPGGVFDRSIAV